MIRLVLHALPLFWPGVSLSALLALWCSRPLSRHLGCHRSTAFLLLLSLGGIAALTLLPGLTGNYFENVRHASRSCATAVRLPRPSDLADANQDSLNIALFVPLGLAVTLIPSWWRVAACAVSAVVLPLGIEAVQYALPWLLRACDLQDVADNVTGLALGLAAGCVARPLLRAVAGGGAVRGRHRGPEPRSRLVRTSESPAPRSSGTRQAADEAGAAPAAASDGLSNGASEGADEPCPAADPATGG
ncbi:VanZ family protein [Streptomyces sp. NPDC020362]|uniref:VanZ family protein n=1 Tax=unclassified Streptomyces TaxID=2593676 RepID=UPI0034059470